MVLTIRDPLQCKHALKYIHDELFALEAHLHDLHPRAARGAAKKRVFEKKKNGVCLNPDIDDRAKTMFKEMLLRVDGI